jgi:hypothetical protein
MSRHAAVTRKKQVEKRIMPCLHKQTHHSIAGSINAPYAWYQNAK